MKHGEGSRQNVLGNIKMKWVFFFYQHSSEKILEYFSHSLDFPWNQFGTLDFKMALMIWRKIKVAEKFVKFSHCEPATLLPFPQQLPIKDIIHENHDEIVGKNANGVGWRLYLILNVQFITWLCHNETDGRRGGHFVREECYARLLPDWSSTNL